MSILEESWLYALIIISLIDALIIYYVSRAKKEEKRGEKEVIWKKNISL